MEFLLNRYRNLSVLLVVIFAQLVLLAYQVKSNGDVRLIRRVAVGAVTPMARVLEATRSGVSRFFSDYFVLIGVREENKKMKAELERIKLENQFLHTELSTADRAKSLAIFQASSPSKYVAAHIIGNTPGSGGMVIVDRGASSGIANGMAVITPDGIVGKVVRVFSGTANVLLVTDPTFAAGVISQKNRVHGTLKGKGESKVSVEHVQNEEKVEEGEWFFTSGDDRIFPKGIPAGQAVIVRQGKPDKEILIVPSGSQNGLEEVLIIVEGVHMAIPELPAANQAVQLQSPPPADGTGTVVPPPSTGTVPASTDADKLVDQYRQIGESQKHIYGDRGNGAPNYNAPVANGTGANSSGASLPTGSSPAAGSNPAKPTSTLSPTTGTVPAAAKPPDPAKPDKP